MSISLGRLLEEEKDWERERDINIGFVFHVRFCQSITKIGNIFLKIFNELRKFSNVH